MRTALLLGLAGLAAGCATHPQPTVPVPPPQHPSVAGTNDGAGGAAHASTQASTTVATGDALTPDAALLRRGYKPAVRDQQLYYCRSEDLTGSRFPKVVCQTADQIKEQEQNTRDALGTTRPQGPCVGPYCH